LTTFATAAAAKASAWSVVITIEGSGNASGLYYYCSQVPTFAVSDTNHRPWIRSEGWPDILSESVDVMGGLPEAGSVSIDLVDIGDALTSEWRTERSSITRTTAAITSSAGTVTVENASNISTDDILFLGFEAVKVTGVAGSTVSIERGKLDSDAVRHLTGQDVYASIPNLRGRKIKVYLSPQDAGSAADFELFGTFHVDGLGLSDDLNSYIVTGKSALKYLDRLIAGNLKEYEFTVNANQNDSRLFLNKTSFASFVGFDGNDALMKFDKEVIQVNTADVAPQIVKMTSRGRMFTQANSADIKQGSTGSLVLAASEDVNLPGSFRFIAGETWTQLSASDKANITRTSHLWTRSAHFVDILLCIMTSSAGDDDLELVNADDTYGNWSSLLAGAGLGIPASKIDYASFLEVKQRTPNYIFDGFYLTSEAKAFREVIAEQILKPIGAYITTEGGSITLRMPRIPALGSTLTNWGTDEILTTPTGERQRLPDLRISQNSGNVYTTISFKTRNVTGGESTITFNDASFEGFGSGRNYYAKEDQALELEINGMIYDATENALNQLAMRKLFRFRRPMWAITASTALDQYARLPGDLIGLTHSDLPDTATGGRGWVNVPCEIVGRELRVNDDEVLLHWSLVAFPQTRIGRIPPSGYIETVSGPDGSGNYQVTVAANLYTDPNALGGLPTDDAAAFRVSDVVTVLDTDGSDASSANTQEVQSISGQRIVIDGNFAGNLAAGQVLVFADRADAISAQYDYFVYEAATTDSPPNIGASSDEPWRYGE